MDLNVEFARYLLTRDKIETAIEKNVTAVNKLAVHGAKTQTQLDMVALTLNDVHDKIDRRRANDGTQ